MLSMHNINRILTWSNIVKSMEDRAWRESDEKLIEHLIKLRSEATRLNYLKRRDGQK